MFDATPDDDKVEFVSILVLYQQLLTSFRGWLVLCILTEGCTSVSTAVDWACAFAVSMSVSTLKLHQKVQKLHVVFWGVNVYTIWWNRQKLPKKSKLTTICKFIVEIVERNGSCYWWNLIWQKIELILSSECEVIYKAISKFVLFEQQLDFR